MRPLDEVEWPALRREVGAHRLWGLLAEAIAARDWPATEQQGVEALDDLAGGMAHALKVEAELLAVVDLLNGEGVDVRVLKGSAVAHLDYPDPVQRAFVDVDLLVRPAHFGRAATVLEHAGYVRDLPERRRRFDGRFAKESTFYARSAVEIDVHRTLALGAFGHQVRTDDLWQQGDTFLLAGRQLESLDGDGRLLHAAYNAMLGDPRPRLVALRDVAQLMARPIDLEPALERARGWGGVAVVAAALQHAQQVFRLPVAPPYQWAAEYRPSRRERMRLRTYPVFGGSNTLTLLGGALGLAGADRMAYLRALVFPDSAYVRARRAARRPSERLQGLRELARSRR